jgi:hypothetical protein
MIGSMGSVNKVTNTAIGAGWAVFAGLGSIVVATGCAAPTFSL